MGIRVLLAEDNPTNQRIALHMLERLGCIPELVADGIEVLRRLDEARFDLVLMDVQMPRLDGLQATLEIRRREAEAWRPAGNPSGPRHLPIIAMTANATVGDRERCLAARMDDYLSKPVTLERLAQVLGRWAPSAASAWPAVAPPIMAPQAPPVLRRERLEEVSQGDAEFEREYLDCLLSDVTGGLDRLRAALDPFDPLRAATLLHGIVGACRTVGADALGQAARVAEEQSKSPGFSPIPGWLDPVEAARDRLVAAIAEHLGDTPERGR